MAFCLWLATGLSVNAQTWPARPITLVFGFGPGGSGDLVARRFAEFASAALAQPVIVENRPGGGGVVAPLAVSKAAADGYTILLHANGPMVVRPILDPSTGYDPAGGFSPIGLVGETPNVIIAGANFQARSVHDVVEWATKHPGLMTVGHPGLGTMGHLGGLLLASKAGITANYVAYRDNTQMLPDILGGRIDIGVAAYNPPQKAANILAVMTDEPVEFLPGVPSMREAGFPGVYASLWWALFGPPRLPPEIVAKLNNIMNAFLRSEDARTQMNQAGLRPLGGSAEDLARRMAEEKLIWSKIVADAQIRLTDQK
jgi:tripartite-type tricarboxylate transporter receptor subunit TctC